MSNFRFKKTHLLYITTIILIGGLCFYLGVIWHQELGFQVYLNKLPISKLTCFGINNLQETYQHDCYIDQKRNKFTFRNALNCHRITNHSISTSTYNDKLDVLTIKDYEPFTLSINNKDNLLTISEDRHNAAKGSHKILHDDNNSVLALRKIPVNVVPFTNYQYIYFSKTSGLGTISWNDITPNDDGRNSSVATVFFQCD